LVTAPFYLCSDWERYPSRDVLYFTTIAFFVVRTPGIENLTARDDIDAYQLIRPGDID
jgi:hypothetical protein